MQKLFCRWYTLSRNRDKPLCSFFCSVSDRWSVCNWVWYLKNKRKDNIKRGKEGQMSSIIIDNILYMCMQQKKRKRKIHDWDERRIPIHALSCGKKLDEWSIGWVRCWISNVVCTYKETERENKTSVKKNEKRMGSSATKVKIWRQRAVTRHTRCGVNQPSVE